MFSFAPRRLHSILIAPAFLPLLIWFSPRALDNHPPVAVNDSYTTHGCGITLSPEITANDYDPDGDQITIVAFPQSPTHGAIARGSSNIVFYCPNYGYVGSDTFTYQICDSQGACATGTVSLNVVNQAPNAGNDSYNVHGATVLGPFLVNDSDPDGDSVSCGDVAHECVLTSPQHGGLSGLFQSDKKFYGPNYGYTGADSFTYNACDGLGLCTPTTVSLSVNDNAPVATDDWYLVRPGTFIGPFLINDYDPDGDAFGMGGTFQEGIVTYPQHGTLVGITQPDKKSYNPNQGFVGSDSFTYAICDEFGKCSTATVRLYVIGDGENDGVTSCNTNVGGPVNVTNGNMYLQQGDYQLPGVGYAINVTRTYNSDSQLVGLFGRGWSTAYDESIVSYDSNQVRFNQGDGRAQYFVRPTGGTGPFTPVVGDFHGQLIQNANGSYSLTLQDGSVHQFNSSGRLLSLTDHRGNATTLGYDVNGLLASITDPFGRSLNITTGTTGQVASIADSIGTVATYTYSSASRLVSVVYADNSGFQFSYDSNYRLLSVTDALGHIVESHTYDSSGRALTSERQGGVEHYALNYVSGTETDVTDALGHVTKYTFDTSRGRNVVTKVEGLCNCGGGNGSQVQSWAYDNNLNLTSKTDALGHTSSYTYDDKGNVLTKTDSLGTSTYTYNSLSEVLTSSDPIGLIATNVYDSYGNLLSVTNTQDKTTTFTYNARGQVLTATDALSHKTEFSYNASGNRTQTKDALNHVTQFAYDARGRQTSTTSALSEIVGYEYDSVGRPKKVTQPDGSFVTTTYDLAGRPTEVSDARNSMVSPTPTPTPTPTPLVDPIADWSHVTSHSSNFAIEASGYASYFNNDDNRASRTDGAEGSVVWNYAGLGSFEMITYHSTGYSHHDPAFETSVDGTNWTSITPTITSDGGSDGSWPRYYYRTSGLSNVNYVRATFAATSSAGWTLKLTQMTLTAAPPPSQTLVDSIADWSHTDSHSTNFGIEASGYASYFNGDDNRASRTDGDEGSVAWHYPGLQSFQLIAYHNNGYTHHDPTFDTSTDGVSWTTIAPAITSDGGSDSSWPRYYYQASSLSNANYIRARFAATGSGSGWTLKLTQMTMTAPTGPADPSLYNPTVYSYDGANRTVSVTDAANHAKSYTYDSMSNVTSTTDALGRVTNYDYDDFNRLVKITYPPAASGATRLFETLEYDSAGNVTKRIDTAGRATTYLYDTANRVTKVTDPTLQASNFEYSARSQLTAVVDALNQRYTFAYDALGRQTQVGRGGLTMHYAYDDVGNRIQRTDYNGVVTGYAYDALNRLTTITYPGNNSVTYSYDAVSRLTSATNANGTVATTYDNRGRVAGTTDVFNQLLGYSYDANGNRTGLTLNGAAYASYTYDTVNRLTTLADASALTFNYSYDAANRLNSRSAPNGVTMSLAYDGMDRLTSLNHTAGATSLIANQYTYDTSSNIASWANGYGNHAYTYDGVDRLASATNSVQPNESYGYDAVGNRTSSPLSATYGYQPFNKLTSSTTAGYSYNGDGSLVSKTDASGPTTYSYDEENRLKQVTLPGGLTVNYKYDALGRRIQRTTSAGANERYVYDGADVLIDLNADWSVATTYFNGLGIDNHLRQSNSMTGVSYFLNDHLGSTAALTDVSGNILEQPVYDAFGNGSGNSRTRYGYTGRERDTDTGMLYYRARFYDPSIGRFLSEDPLQLDAGINFYAYVHNDPLKYKDPLGLTVWVCSRLTHPPESWVGANHSYFFDDRNGQACGLSGPRMSLFPFYGSTAPEKGPSEGATCRPIDGSDNPAKADQIMNCCKGYRSVDYTPGISDCHNLTHSCLRRAGLKDPGAPGGRFGDRCIKCNTPAPPKVDWNNSSKCWGGARGC
ncbi:MAG: hypothetical protein QOH71_1829 [Blastocatellia bacterium]|jgi:RHS repeat-associated protein|nr:hypothetical protein [Blastocatellia bacterium]